MTGTILQFPHIAAGGKQRVTFDLASKRPLRSANFTATLGLWLRRYAERRKLARDLQTFTDEMLRDFGISRSEAERIAATPFWRA
ncbi:DUF1127 domain-containing protein [Rhizobium sp. S-51]|uniref:DUF1127 domain-containing protein n=1 Tax=Rhizobium terricola TaxID=2728849 RepID=A0A7Y0AVX5_9HYPH|nr:DUF1127 domain-containing protein [Rhizobium terricola]